MEINFIFFKTIDEKTFKIPYVDDMTAKEAKFCLKNITPYEIQYQTIIFQGSEIPDDVRLSEKGVRTGFTVTFIYHLLSIFYY
jgi:hypothetical protein